MRNLVKLCVGIGAVSELDDAHERRLARAAGYGPNLHLHRTRMMPKAAAELIGKGSLYWVIAGAIQCRQQIIDLVSITDHEGRRACDILLDPRLVLTRPQPRRPFQGWRYLSADDAPQDLAPGEAIGEGDPALEAELIRLGLV